MSVEAYLNATSNQGNSSTFPPDDFGWAFSLRITILYILMYVPLWVCIVVGNLMVILAFVYNKELRRVQNYPLISLAVTDLLTGISALPALLLVRLTVSPLVCSASTRFSLIMPSFTFCGSSIYHLLFIAIDRCVSLTYPLKYPSLVTSRRMVRVLSLLWIYNVWFALIPLYIPNPAGEDRWLCYANENYDNELDVIFILIGSFLPIYFLFMMILYAVMLYIAFKHIRTRKAMSYQASPHRTRNGARARMRGILTMAIVVGAFGICWLPSSFKFFYQNYAPTTKEGLITVQTITEYLSFTNSMVNPLIYGYFNCQFRIGFKMVLERWSCRIRGRCNRDDKENAYSTGMTNLALSVSTESINEPSSKGRVPSANLRSL